MERRGRDDIGREKKKKDEDKVFREPRWGNRGVLNK